MARGRGVKRVPRRGPPAAPVIGCPGWDRESTASGTGIPRPGPPQIMSRDASTRTSSACRTADSRYAGRAPGRTACSRRVRGLQISGPHRRGESVNRIVRDRERLANPIHLDDGRDRSEDLLASYCHRVVDAGEQRRIDVAAGQVGRIAPELEARRLVYRARCSRACARCDALTRGPRFVAGSSASPAV